MDLTLLLMSAKVGAALVGRVFRLLENNRPVYQMTQELGSGLYVASEGMSIETVSRHRWPKVMVRRVKGYYAGNLFRLAHIEPKAIWYCSYYDGNWYIADARVAIDVKAIRPSQDVAADVVFRQPYLDSNGTPGVGVSVLPLDLHVVHRSRTNHREETTIAMIRADGRLAHIA